MMPSPDHPRIYIFGASGTGTTTLGAGIAAALNLVHVDTDDHYWAPVDPPYSVKRPPQERVPSIESALGEAGWVLTGACQGWGRKITDRANLLVFATLSTPLRLQRLRARELARFGDRIEEGGDMFNIHRDFIRWASRYDDPGFYGRNRDAHESWLALQSTPVIRVDAEAPIEAAQSAVLARVSELCGMSKVMG